MTETIHRIALLLLLCLLPTSAAAQQLADFETKQLLVALQGNPDTGYRMSIRPKGGLDSLQSDLTARVFAISSPSRLVIDIPNVSGTDDKRLDLQDARLQRLRLGKHPEKTRFVIDIRDNLKPEYSVRSDATQEALLVDFQVLDEVMTQSEPEPQPTPKQQLVKADPQPTPEPVQATPEPIPATPEPATPAPQELEPEDPEDEVQEDADALLLKAIQAAQQESANKPPEEAEDSKTPMFVVKNNQKIDPATPPREQVSPKEQITQPANDASATVQGIFFQAPKGSSSGGVMIDVENISTYSLNQRNENLYELVLADAKLSGSHLLLPQFPPEAFGGFEVLVARERGSQVLIKVYVAAGTTLFPYIANEKLWLKTEEQD